MDIYVHQNNLTALEQVVKGFGMSFSYLINDVQGAVDKENPATASRDGRFRYYQYNRLSSVSWTCSIAVYLVQKTQSNAEKRKGRNTKEIKSNEIKGEEMEC